MASASRSKAFLSETAAILAQRLSESLIKERIVPRFVDSYVVEHGRYGLQVHAPLYRDLLTLLQREALLAASARALDIAAGGRRGQKRTKASPMSRKEAAAFRQKYVAALTRQQRWDMGASLEFQSDLRMYEDIVARAGGAKRTLKPFEAANHPFVDRCAFVLDSSFLEQARVAASRALCDLERLTDTVTESTLEPSPATKSSGRS